jgi:hypothetical protein
VHLLTWLVPLLVVTSLTRAQAPGGDTTVLPIADPALATLIVARVGPAAITAREFLLSYEFGPAFVKRQHDAKRRHLEFMINEKLLALSAADRGGRSSPEVRRSVREIVGDLATEELYRDDVLSKVRLGEEEIREAVAGQGIHFTIRWLYGSTREGIDHYRRLLSSGMGFDSLFTLSLGDSITADLRSWETDRFRLKRLRPSIAAVVDTLRPHVASAPLEGPDGWYIVSLIDVNIDAIMTESEGVKRREDARRALTQQKADSLSDLYINRIMLEHAPVIEPRTFDLLGAYLGQFWLSESKRATMVGGLSVGRETALTAMTDIGQFGKEPLVRMKDRAVTLGRFLSWYRAREFVLRLRASSVQAYRVSLQQMVWRMVRDGLLIERAKKRHLEERASVRTQKQWWEDKVLYALEKRRITDSVAVDDAKLLRYFREHQKSYRDSTGLSLSFAAAKERVRQDFTERETTNRLLHRVLALRRKYPVQIVADVLRNLPVENENDPKAIDVYVAKKNGTFPHPAFPTIDVDWQGWQ